MGRLTHTVSGAVATVHSPAVAPIRSLKAHFLPKQAGRNDALPSNVRELSGNTGINLYKCEANIFDISSAMFVNNYYLDQYGTAQSQEGSRYNSTYIEIEPSTDYYIRFNKNGQGRTFSVCMYKSNKTFIKRVVLNTGTAGYGIITVKLSTTADTAYMRFSCGTLFSDIIFCKGSASEVSFSRNMLSPTIYNLAITNGNYIAGGSDYRSVYAKMPGAGKYTISRDAISGNRFRLYAAQNEPANGGAATLIKSADSSLSYTFDFPEGYSYLLVYLANNGSTITSNIMLNPGETALPYEPYSNTIYGGYVETTAGGIVSEWGYKLYTGASDENWGVETVSAGVNFYIKAPTDWKKGANVNDLYCNVAKATNSTLADGTAKVSNGGYLNLCIGDLISVSTVEGFKAWLSEHNVQVAVRLEEPVVVGTITGQQISTLRGITNIWNDGNGSNEVEYDLAENAEIMKARKRFMANEQHYLIQH